MRKLSKNKKIVLSIIGMLLLVSIIIAINLVSQSNQPEQEEPVITEEEAEESVPKEDPIENEEQPNGPIEVLPTEEGEPARSDEIVEDTDLN